MNPVRFAIDNPVKVTVGVLLLLLFGLIAMSTIPIQLVPNVDEPVITITTQWTGASPAEIEQEVVEEQEDKLKGVSGLKKMKASASQDTATIELDFEIGTSITRALQEVSDKLREVPDYPDDTDEPVVEAADASSENAIAWMILTSSDPDFDIQAFYDFADKRIKPYLERVDGVAEVNIFGGREREVQIRVDPSKLAQRNIPFEVFLAAIQQDNVNVSAGELPEGRLDVRIRTVGQYDDLETIRQTVVAYAPDGGPIRVRDLGDVILTLQERRGFVRYNGQPGLAINAIRESGANVIDAMTELKNRLEYVNENLLNDTVLPGVGDTLSFVQVYDETLYIYAALRLVRNNLALGGLLAIVTLLLFLRTIRPTLVVAMAIPLSVIGTFVVMTGIGSTLNVISMAGLAFAVGMVVDNAIVVLENIDRHLAMGKKATVAAYDAATEVWGAILASTLTTLAVFFPILFVKEEAGQLFRDIAIAIMAAVALSLIVSITVIPSAASRFLKSHKKNEPDTTSNEPDTTSGAAALSDNTKKKRKPGGLFGLAAVFNTALGGYTNLVYTITKPTLSFWMLRVVIVVIITFVSLLASYLLMPPASYLPQGNRNLIFGIMLSPPAYNVDQRESIGTRIETGIRPYWEANSYEDLEKTADQRPPIIDFITGEPITNIPPIDGYFFVSFGQQIFMGATSFDNENVRPLAPVISSAMGGIPGSFGFAQQASLFGRGFGTGNSIDLEISGPDLDTLRQSADAIYLQLASRFGFDKIRPDPLNFNLTGPEVQIQIDQVRAKELGLDVRGIGLGVQALVDGSILGDYRIDGETIDIRLIRHPDFPLTRDTLAAVPLATASARASGATGSESFVLPLSSVAKIVSTQAPQQINRIEQLRSITLTVIPPEEIPLETAEKIVSEIVSGLRESGAVSPAVETNSAGTADKLSEVRGALIGGQGETFWDILTSILFSRFFIALLITYLLMAALFESFLYPFVIMFTVPLATVGGFLGLRIVHEFVPTQQLDTLTMLGFVILIGVVVNNAILIVHQTINFMKGLGESGNAEEAKLLGEDKTLEPREALRASVRSRFRPIMMTTMTSILGMAPLVFMPGSGSELYRGLGSVMLGGLLMATFFTLVLVPILFSVVMDVRAYVIKSWR